MEYFIYVTKDCNLKCTYCSGKNIRHSSTSSLPLADPDMIASRITEDIHKHGHPSNRVMFYGGEPLLNQVDIENLLDRLRLIGGMAFGLYTNGTLLAKINNKILDALDVLFISIDGTESTHDSCRGKGTFRLVLENVERLRSSYCGETVANMTITPQASLFDAVGGILGQFDHIHWNIVNGLPFSDANGFLSKYTTDIQRLLSLWIDRMRLGDVVNLVPFQAVVAPLIEGVCYPSYRCGYGTRLRVVDVDGTFWLCDELIGDTRFLVNENETVDFEEWDPAALSEQCRACDCLPVCGGGCIVNLLYHSEERERVHCPATKFLIRSLRKPLPMIRALLEKEVIQFQQIKTRIIHEGWTEGIP